MPLRRLPSELYLHVLHYLQEPSDLLPIRLVSRTLYSHIDGHCAALAIQKHNLLRNSHVKPGAWYKRGCGQGGGLAANAGTRRHRHVRHGLRLRRSENRCERSDSVRGSADLVVFFDVAMHSWNLRAARWLGTMGLAHMPQLAPGRPRACDFFRALFASNADGSACQQFHRSTPGHRDNQHSRKAGDEALGKRQRPGRIFTHVRNLFSAPSLSTERHRATPCVGLCAKCPAYDASDAAWGPESTRESNVTGKARPR
ncbi:uncharacterized protein B0I36DRAFT_353376 [Microdochium trichocladiopsis]|uniref:F-box domain-containing protein n=1 Tax=Microdochium trichocladiopsis TaxID=1682393 RepID=A0A9P8XYM8_9PEZI|nr:uncharacterized protein B0I36DRAFT_353376 [Microdochium trichocladiopsis]KAH7025233.1 hypothetical protein B0I36DRAFT_353376 [Microdochium trichocladiopsis]